MGSCGGLPVEHRRTPSAVNVTVVPKNDEGARGNMKRLIKLDVLTETDAGNFTRQQ